MGKRKVLIVDDELGGREALRITLFFVVILFPYLALAADPAFVTGELKSASKTRALNSRLVQEAYAWNQAQTQTQTQSQTQPQYLNSQFTYTYDNVGNRTSMTSPQGIQTYTYDPLYQLRQVTGAQSHTYQYDPVGNRTLANGVPYIPNPLNQYTDVGGTPFTYDPNGNLTSDGTYTYTYDYENRLKKNRYRPGS